LKEQVDVTKIISFAMEIEVGMQWQRPCRYYQRLGCQFNLVKQEHQLGACDTSNNMFNGMGWNVGRVLFDSTGKGWRQRLSGSTTNLAECYEPSPAHLAVFLLWLATEVNWNDKEPCFRGICRELGHYYSVVEQDKSVQHMLFPAILCLLSPTLRVDASMRKLIVLSNLYKAFDR
jgi:hypothetical protein